MCPVDRHPDLAAFTAPACLGAPPSARPPSPILGIWPVESSPAYA